MSSQLSQDSRPQLTQDTRIGEFRTPLGKDTLVLTRFDGVEGLSELFEYRIEAVSLKEDIDFDGAIGQNCSVTLKTYGSGGGSGGFTWARSRAISPAWGARHPAPNGTSTAS